MEEKRDFSNEEEDDYDEEEIDEEELFEVLKEKKKHKLH
jgi:hypothetical protein